MKKGMLLVGALAGLLLMSACSSSESKSEQSDGKGQVTLSYMSWDPNEAKGLRKVADEFEKENPSIKINMETTPWDQYWVKFDSAAKAGNLADIVTMHPIASYASMSGGALMKLDDTIKNGPLDLNNYYEGIIDPYKMDGNVYAIPKDVTDIGLWYNKKIFDDAGVAYPDDTWTWETLKETAKKLTNKEKGIYGFAAPNDYQNGYSSFIFQNGGSTRNANATKSTFNTPDTIDALKWWIDFSLKDKTSPTAQQLTENNAETLLQSGRVAMITHGNWLAPQFRDNEYTKKNIDVAVLPKGKERATMMNGLGWSIAKNTKHPKEAVKFLEFLGSKKANEIQASSGAAIPAYKGIGEQWAKSYDGVFHAQAFVDMLNYGKTKPFSKNSTKVESIEGETLNPAFDGSDSVDHATKLLQEKQDEILSEQQ